MNAKRLDRWLPEPAVRTHHRRATSGDPARLWAAALTVRLSDTQLLGNLIRWRIPGTRPEQTFDELFRTYPFTVLEEDDGILVSGLCGRIWTLARDYPRLGGPQAFEDWNESGTVRVLFGHWVQRGEGDRVELVSEARVQPVDPAAARRLRILWAVVGRFEPLVGAEALKAALQGVKDETVTERRSPARDRPAGTPNQ